jgi:hypothetical protein
MTKRIQDIFMINRCKHFILLIFFSLSCTYGVDKLVVKNNSKSNICYQVLIKYKNKNSYYHAGVGKEMEPNSKNSPVIKETILDAMKEFSNDKILYIIYYTVKDRDYVHENLEHIVGSKKIKIDRYSLKELDSMNWVISYPALRSVP